MQREEHTPVVIEADEAELPVRLLCRACGVELIATDADTDADGSVPERVWACVTCRMEGVTVVLARPDGGRGHDDRPRRSSPRS